MPFRNQMIEITPLLQNLDIESLEDVQPAPKYLLRCMKEIPKNNENRFRYSDLLTFMNYPIELPNTVCVKLIA